MFTMPEVPFATISVLIAAPASLLWTLEKHSEGQIKRTTKLSDEKAGEC